MKRILALVLSAALCSPGWGAPVREVGRRPLEAPLSQPQILGALDLHLDRIGGLSQPESPGTLSLDQGLSAPVLSPAEYLAHAALSTPVEAPELSPQAQAARYLTAALADPGEMARALATLREAGTPQARAVAHKLVRASVSDRRAIARLHEFFQLAPAGDSLEELAAYAERLFSGGLGRAAVAAPAAPALPQAVPEDGELRARVELSPLTNPERERAIVELFQKAGAAPADIKLQDAGDGRHNIYVVEEGETDHAIVVGGHHDKVSEGAGTIDNWTGATMAVSALQGLAGTKKKRRIYYVAFAREEEGLVGSRAFVDMLRKQGVKVDAMVNLDTLAVDGTFSWKNNSDRPLLKMIRQVADAERLDLAEAMLYGGDADSSSFRRAGIPAITVFGASDAVIWDIIHSARDTIAAFSLPHYVNAYKLVVALLRRLLQDGLTPPAT